MSKSIPLYSPMSVPDGGVLEFPNGPEACQHVLHRGLKALVGMPLPHAFVQRSEVLEQQDFNVTFQF